MIEEQLKRIGNFLESIDENLAIYVRVDAKKMHVETPLSKKGLEGSITDSNGPVIPGEIADNDPLGIGQTTDDPPAALLFKDIQAVKAYTMEKYNKMAPDVRNKIYEILNDLGARDEQGNTNLMNLDPANFVQYRARVEMLPVTG